MALHDIVVSLRARRIANGHLAVPNEFQGISKLRIRQVLTRLDLGTNEELIDAVFALLDNETDSWFGSAPQGAKFCDGASTAQLACHIGILQRGGGKLDREGRDYWIKPLRDLGGINAVFLKADTREFIPGHPVAKSSNSAYRLDDGFKAILQASEERWPAMLTDWVGQDAARARREFQAQLAEISRGRVDTGHSDLIQACITHYVQRFLPGYQVVYVDDGDGDRITDEDRARLGQAGITLQLGDAMPDVLLWNPMEDSLWVIEAVTSDGEVDLHKVRQLSALADRCHKRGGIKFTTAYRTWKEAASRQGPHKNIAVRTYLWIQEDPSKHFYAIPY